jgi:DNA-binding CsgD family transcriptional regulator
VARGEASEIRAAHSRYFAGREADILALWDSPRQRAAYAWFTVELANLRTAFRWAADQGDLDVAATIASFAGLLGVGVQTLEPIAWAEELVEPARVADHPRLAFLYVIASQCYATGRIEAAVGYADAGQIVVGRSRDGLPYGIEAWLGVVYLAIGQPERLAEWCRAQLVRRRDTHVYIRGWLVNALVFAGSGGEAMDSAGGLIEAAEATGNPSVLAWALFAYGGAFRDADPVGALNALGRGLVIAQDSGNRAIAVTLASVLARLEAEHGGTVSAFDHLTLAIRNLHNAGDTTTIRVPLAVLAVLFDRLGRYEPAATIAGFALSPIAEMGVPEITTAITHLRDVLGDQAYESLAHRGETMTTAAMATYAYDQMDQARTELETYAQRGRGERNRPTSGWASLTPTERDVVRLVSEGLANKDIATRLFVSPRTVQTHLTHVYTKLGLTSRVQLAQEAAHHA